MSSFTLGTSAFRLNFQKLFLRIPSILIEPFCLEHILKITCLSQTFIFQELSAGLVVSLITPAAICKGGSRKVQKPFLECFLVVPHTVIFDMQWILLQEGVPGGCGGVCNFVFYLLLEEPVFHCFLISSNSTVPLKTNARNSAFM